MLSSEDLEALDSLADCMARREAVIIDKVRASVIQDAGAQILGDKEFLDHLPEILRELNEHLRHPAATLGGPSPARGVHVPVGKHGFDRWMQGYTLSQVIREWRHLLVYLLRETFDNAQEIPQLSQEAIIGAIEEISLLITAGIEAGAEQYTRMHRVGMASMAAELQASLERLQEIERERARMWRSAVHDLRGGLGAVTSAAELLKQQKEAQDTVRHQTAAKTESSGNEFSQEALARGIASLREMLTDLAMLARLDAAQEELLISRFDASDLLRKLATSIRPSAVLRDLTLEVDGPEVLQIEGDALKVRRIAQNLLINAVKYTDRGTVGMSWQPDATAPGTRWVLTVHDSGPGLDTRLASSVVAALMENPARRPRLSQSTMSRTDEGAARSAERQRGNAGEGIGLSIVKVLCRLLGAAIELDNVPGRGLTFRVIFPSVYG